MKSTMVVIAYMIGYFPIMIGQAILIDTLLRGRRKVAFKTLVIAYVICYLIQLVVYVWMPTTTSSIFINLFSSIAPILFVCIVLYHGTVLASIFAAMSTAFGALGEMLTICVMSVATKVPVSEVMDVPRLTAVGLIMSGLVTTSILFIASVLCQKFQRNNSNLPEPYLVAMILTIAGSLVVVYTLFVNMFSGKPVNEVMLMGIVTMLLGINFFVLYLYRRMLKELENKYRTMLLAQRGEAYAHELQLVKKKTQEVRSLRHDLKNHAVALQELLAQGKLEDAKNYISRFSQTLEGTAKYAVSGCAELDSVINYKLDMAIRAEVKIDCTLLVPETLEMDPFDINVLFGNLLDNAIEAARKCEDKTIQLLVKWDRGALYISVKNTYDGIVNRDMRGNILTRKSDATLHGLGLSNVKSVLEKYNGELKIDAGEKIFSVSAVLYPAG